MFGLTLEKLVLVALVAALIIGPRRLPELARRLGETVRTLRAFVDESRRRAVRESGLDETDWQSLDPRRYDPRRIVREALAQPEPAPAPTPVRWRIEGSSAHPRRVRVVDD